jgi:anti-sigma regulatory factor (Ser/Thr protein kinase)
MAVERVITAQGGNDSPVVPSAGQHRVRFYDRDDQLVAELAGALVEALTQGEAFVCVATAEHRAQLEATLAARGVDLQAAPYWALDAAELLSSFMADGHPHPALFESAVGALLEDAGAGGRPVQVYGEMVALLWAQGDAGAALELEELWNVLARTRDFALLCGYPTTALETAGLAEASAACAAHTAVLPPASYAGPPEAPVVPGSIVLLPVHEAVPAARRFLMSVLPIGLEDEQRSDAALMVSELATNAVRHASSAFRLSVRESDGVVRITVQDAAWSAPRPGDAAPEDRGGRGVSIVGALADEWGYDLLGDGKAVWAELALP